MIFNLDLNAFHFEWLKLFKVIKVVNTLFGKTSQGWCPLNGVHLMVSTQGVGLIIV